MPFIRLSDNYIDHPKFIVLSDRAFRLWHEGMAYCRKHQTDGAIPTAALRGFRYARPDPVRELSNGSAPLWEPIAEFGFRVHDYLDWNPSRAEEQRRQQEARDRTAKWRGNASRDASRNTSRDAYVPDRIGSDEVSSEGDTGELTGYQTVLAAYRDRWKRAYGYECGLLETQLEIMKIQQHVKAHGASRIVAAVDAYFATESKYVRDAKHPLPLFLRDPIKFLAREATVSARPKGCLHDPVCADDAAHTARRMTELRRVE